MDVAIIDTGIDYTHPDLGGCFGIGCRVAGGWDFYNNDGDPMDDHSHGTHVAGIVAASGAITGVAPSAHLWAFKVLDAGGYGYASTIIAGIERTADLDGDPITVDPADVANISLGGYGTPDDPMSLAVDAAVDSGVVIAVAAGNSGPSAGSLLSPGVARKAITVAASSKGDYIAWFSSHGPVTNYDSLLKPDITAPGVSINSTVPNAGYDAFSGTSMAAPHVAGAVALLKQLHPNWSPLRIKSNLMNTALDLGIDLFAQGSGRLQVAEAASAPLLVMPASIDLGRAGVNDPAWQVSEPITIVNRTSSSATYSLTISATLPAEVVAELTETSVTVEPGKSHAVRLILHWAPGATGPAALPDPDELAIGAVQVRNGETVAESRFALSLTGQLLIRSNASYGVVVVHNDKIARSAGGYFYWGYPVIMRLPLGVYDVMASFSDTGTPSAPFPAHRTVTWVVNEGIVVNGVTEITIDPIGARNAISLHTSAGSASAAVTHAYSALSHPDHQVALVEANELVGDELLSRVSNASSAYRLEAHTFSQAFGRTFAWYEGYFRQEGVQGGVMLEPNPGLLRHKVVQMAPAGIDVAFRVERCVRPYWPGVQAAPNVCLPILANTQLPYVADLYVAPILDDAVLQMSSYRVYKAANRPYFYALPTFLGPDMTMREDGTLRIYATDALTLTPVLTTTSDLIPIGAAPPVWAGTVSVDEGLVCIAAPRPGNSIQRAPFVLRSQVATVPITDTYDIVEGVPFSLGRGANTIIAGKLYFSSVSPNCYYLDPNNPGAYTLHVGYPHPYTINGKSAGIAADLDFDTTRLGGSCPDADPPILTGLDLVVAGNLQFAAPPAKPFEVQFTVADLGPDCKRVASVQLEYKTASTWSVIPTQVTNGAYVARFPALPLGTTVSLRVIVTDGAGNRLTYTADPAFSVDKPLTVPAETSFQFLPAMGNRRY
ncbi:MAG: S8 family serine peptidase [Anaerolineales bacterium]|nr:S8 family serine peptidase [Anaerolineales bacterium]